LLQTSRPLFLFCLFAQASLLGILGSALAWFAHELVPYAVGMGMVTYAFAILVYSLISVWRARHRQL